MKRKTAENGWQGWRALFTTSMYVSLCAPNHNTPFSTTCTSTCAVHPGRWRRIEDKATGDSEKRHWVCNWKCRKGQGLVDDLGLGFQGVLRTGLWFKILDHAGVMRVSFERGRLVFLKKSYVFSLQVPHFIARLTAPVLGEASWMWSKDLGSGCSDYCWWFWM